MSGNASIQLVWWQFPLPPIYMQPRRVFVTWIFTLFYRSPLSLWPDNAPWASSNSTFSPSPTDPVRCSMPYLLCAALKTELFLFQRVFSGTQNVASESFSSITDIYLHNMPYMMCKKVTCFGLGSSQSALPAPARKARGSVDKGWECDRRDKSLELGQRGEECLY